MGAGNKLLTASWNLSQGTSRELLSTILSERLDEVLVEADDIEQLRQVERLGFPLEPADAGCCGDSTTPLPGTIRCKPSRRPTSSIDACCSLTCPLRSSRFNITISR